MKTYFAKAFFVLLAVNIALALASGCAPPQPTTSTALATDAEASSGRMVITSASYFVDTRGYTRDILVLHDTQTGQDYLAVMGAGVTQICSYDAASHSTKCREED